MCMDFLCLCVYNTIVCVQRLILLFIVLTEREAGFRRDLKFEI